MANEFAGLETHGKQEREAGAKPWHAKKGSEALAHAVAIKSHAGAITTFLFEDADSRPPTGESREAFARDTMAALEAEVEGLREALGVVSGFSGAEQ